MKNRFLLNSNKFLVFSIRKFVNYYCLLSNKISYFGIDLEEYVEFNLLVINASSIFAVIVFPIHEPDIDNRISNNFYFFKNYNCVFILFLKLIINCSL